jgi:hypothetical protein
VSESDVSRSNVLPEVSAPAGDFARWGGQALVEVIRTHPQIIIGGILHENPFFVPPDEFLREVRTRQAHHQPVLRQ